jgi:hypothetical protein
MEFHPSHLEDLRKSGLTDATIANAGFYTIPPHQRNKEIGYACPGVNSLYAIRQLNLIFSKPINKRVKNDDK